MLTRETRFANALLADFGVDNNHQITNPNRLDLIEWIETEFYIPELNGPMVLFPHQKATLNEACRLDDEGRFIYDLIIYSDIKKSAKSTIAAAVVLYRALNTPWGSFKIVANDLHQADSRVFFYIRRAIELNPRLASQVNIRNYKITFNNHAVIEAIPVDPDGEAGAGDDMIEYTELHAFSSKAALKLWTETTISPIKYGYSQRWIDSYAGHSGESPILEPLYEQVCKPDNVIDIGIPDLGTYALGKIFVLWNTQPRLPWQSPEYYASEAVTLTPHEFARIHRNQWVTSENTFVPIEWWDACKTDELCPPEAPVVVGIDAGVTNDCFAVVGVSRVGDYVYVRFCQIWRPAHGTALDFSLPDKFLREKAAEFNIIQFAYDPYQLHDMATRMRNDGVGWWREFSQSQERLLADKALYDNIRDRRIRHNGNVDLREHIANANSKTEGDKLRIVKRAEHLKIDACVALSMAHAEARRLILT